LKDNKELIAYGDQLDGASSDSCPSEDNLDEKDIETLLPAQPIKKKIPTPKEKPSKKPPKRMSTAKKVVVPKQKCTP